MLCYYFRISTAEEFEKKKGSKEESFSNVPEVVSGNILSKKEFLSHLNALNTNAKLNHNLNPDKNAHNDKNTRNYLHIIRENFLNYKQNIDNDKSKVTNIAESDRLVTKHRRYKRRTPKRKNIVKPSDRVKFVQSSISNNNSTVSNHSDRQIIKENDKKKKEHIDNVDKQVRSFFLF